MTEKRFKLKKIFDIDENPCLCDNGQPLCEIVANKKEKAILLEVLNALHEENIMLKEEIKDFQDLLASREETLCKPIIQENKHLKTIIHTAYETEKTELGKSVLKQLINQME